MPKKLREELASDPYYVRCCLELYHECSGRITWEHALYYAGSKIQARFAIIPLCWWSHLGPGLDKARNQWVALNRATEEDFAAYPRAQFERERDNLNARFGERYQPYQKKISNNITQAIL